MLCFINHAKAALADLFDELELARDDGTRVKLLSAALTGLLMGLLPLRVAIWRSLPLNYCLVHYN